VCARERGHIGCHEAFVEGDSRRWWGDMKLTKPQRRHLLAMLDNPDGRTPWRAEWKSFERLEALGLCRIERVRHEFHFAARGGGFHTYRYVATLTNDGRDLATSLRKDAAAYPPA
jgi:hypothetical protein